MVILTLEELREKFYSISPREIVEMAFEEFNPPTTDGVVFFDLIYGNFYSDTAKDGEQYDGEKIVVVFRLSYFGYPPEVGGYYDDYLSLIEAGKDETEAWEDAMSRWISYVEENLSNKWEEVVSKYSELLNR